MADEREQRFLRRIKRIEDRLAALEVAIMGPPAPVSRPTPPPKPPPPPAQERPARFADPDEPIRVLAEEREPLERPERVHAPIPRSDPRRTEAAVETASSRTGGDLERFFGVAVLGRIGIAAVLLAAAYFAQLAYREMSEVLKVLSIYGLSGALIAAGFALRSRAADKYIALLWGGGAAAAYLAGVTARLAYDLIDPYTTMALLFGASVLGQWLAHKLRHPTLASTALAGAFAAPLLVSDASDHRWLLLGYLMLLHGWSALAERRFGWTMARLVGIIGTIVVASVWASSHAAIDTSTFLIVNGYLVGLVLPELIDLWRAKPLSKARPPLLIAAVAGTEGTLWLLTLGGVGGFALPAFGWITGGAWLLAGLGLLKPARSAKASMAPEGFVTIGGILLTLGCLAAPDALGVEGTTAQVVTAASLAIVAVGLLLLRRVARVGDASASVAAVVCSLTVVLGRSDSTALWLVPVGLLPAAALVWTGRSHVARVVGLLAGAVTLVAGLARGGDLHLTWIPVGIAAGALWLAGTYIVGAKRRQEELVATAAGAMLLLSGLWLVLAFASRLATFEPPTFDRMTWAALAIVLVAGRLAFRSQDRVPLTIEGLLWSSAIGVALLAGHREVAEAVRSLTQAAQDTAHVAYLALAGTAVVALGVSRERAGVRVVGVLLALAACAKVLYDSERFDPSGWTAAELVLAAGGVLAASVLVRRDDANLRLPLIFGYTAVAAAWALHALEGSFAADVPLWNLRFLAGGVVLAIGFALGRVGRGGERTHGTLLLGVGVALGYLVGLAEVLEGSDAMELAGAWPDVLVSVYTTLYAACVLGAGFLLRERRLRYPALAGFFGVVVKVGVHDLAAATIPLRILATGVLGLVLLAAAFAYARRKEAGAEPTESG